MQALHLFERLARFRVLTPITSDPSEWVEVEGGADGAKMWQSLRQPSCLSRDGGVTYYDVDGPPPWWRRALCRMGFRGVSWFPSHPTKAQA